MSACGNPKCYSSTGIHDGLTFGSGTLDSMGYWSRPCRICAADFDKRMNSGERTELVSELVADGYEMAEIKRDHRWLFEPGWPYADTDIEAIMVEGKKREEEEDRLDREFDDLFGIEL